jgi:kindlin 2
VGTGNGTVCLFSDINIEDFVAHRFYKRRGKTRCRSKILEAHANVKDLNLIESKMNFIKVRFVLL